MGNIESFTFKGTDVTMLEHMSEIVGVEPGAFVAQSVRLGIVLGRLALNEHGEIEEPMVFFENEDGEYDGYHLIEEPEASEDITAEEQDLSSRITDADERHIIVPLPRSLIQHLESVSDEMYVSPKTVLELSLFFRWQWSIARTNDREIAFRTHPDAEPIYPVMDFDDPMPD